MQSVHDAPQAGASDGQGERQGKEPHCTRCLGLQIRRNVQDDAHQRIRREHEDKHATRAEGQHECERCPHQAAQLAAIHVRRALGHQLRKRASEPEVQESEIARQHPDKGKYPEAVDSQRVQQWRHRQQSDSQRNNRSGQVPCRIADERRSGPGGRLSSGVHDICRTTTVYRSGPVMPAKNASVSAAGPI